MSLATISIDNDTGSGFELSGATLTALTRLDTDTALTLPSPATFTYDSGEDVWTIDADLPAGVEVYWEADIVYSAGGTSGADGTVIGDGSEDFTLFGARGGMEEKCAGAKNLRIYEFHPGAGVTIDSAEGLTQISQSIEDDLEEANAEMAKAWRKGTVAIAAKRGITFVKVPLGYLESFELRWLNDLAEYGGVVKAWAGRSVKRAATEEVPQQVGTAIEMWLKGIAELEAGTALEDYYDDYTNTEYADQEPVGTFQSVALTFNDDDGVVDEFSGEL